jgi:hypothetical protein
MLGGLRLETRSEVDDRRLKKPTSSDCKVFAERLL